MKVQYMITLRSDCIEQWILINEQQQATVQQMFQISALTHNAVPALYFP